MNSLSHQERISLNVLEGHTGTLGHTVERVFGDVEWNLDFVVESLVKAPEQSTAASEVNAVVHDVGIQFWWVTIFILLSFFWISLIIFEVLSFEKSFTKIISTFVIF